MNGSLAILDVAQKANSDIGNLRQLDLSRPLSLSLSANNACDICHSKGEVLELAAEYEAAAQTLGEDPSEAVFICGGASIYELFFDECDAFYVTRIDEVFDADRFFPNLEEKGFVVTWESEEQIDEATGIRYTFRKYERCQK